MELPNGQAIRQRRGGIREIVTEFDAFVKVTEDVKEEQKTMNGICKRFLYLFIHPQLVFIFSVTIFCFSLIFMLILGELYNYFTNNEVEYRFSVDTAYDE